MKNYDKPIIEKIDLLSNKAISTGISYEDYLTVNDRVEGATKDSAMDSFSIAS